MDNIKKIKWITNPYKKLKLVENKEVRVQALKDVAEFFGEEIKTRKRANTKIENVFFKNDELKELLNKKNITPEENSKIQEQILWDIENIKKDIWLVSKTKENINKSKINNTLIKGFDMWKQFSKKFINPIGKKTWDFIKRNKTKFAVWALIIVATSYWTQVTLNSIDSMKATSWGQIIKYQENNPWNIIAMDKNLEWEDYVKLVNKLWTLKLDNKLKYDINSAEFKEFDILYGKFMWKLKEKSTWTYWKELTKNEGKAFLVMQYTATNTYIDYLKQSSESLKWGEKEKVEYKIISFKMQLNDIEKASSDLIYWKNWDKERIITSWNDHYKIYTNLNWSFFVDWLDRRTFK